MEENNHSSTDQGPFDLGFPFDAEYVANQQAFMDEGAPTEINVWVESTDDMRLWAPLFDKLPNYQFRFLAASSFDSSDGKSANGCTRLLKLLESNQITLGKNQIFCLDSDFKYLASLSSVYTGKNYSIDHIYWTIVHSKENIHMSPGLIDETISHMAGIPKRQLTQSADLIFSQFSNDIFNSLSAMIFLESFYWDSDSEQLSEYKASFKEISSHLKKIKPTNKIPFKTQKFWLSFQNDHKRLAIAIIQQIQQLGLTPQYQDFLKTLTSNGITHHNIYLFMRGHDLEDVMSKVFSIISESYKQQRIADINASSPSSAGEKIKEFMGTWIDFKTCFKARTPKYEQVPFFSETIQKLQENYALD
jgi:hypothetical protein